MIAADAAPWWGSGLFGVLGASVSAITGLILYVLKNRRDDRRRWEPELRQLAAQLITLMHRPDIPLIEYLKHGEDLPPPDIARMKLLVREIQLLSTGEVAVAAQRWLDAMQTNHIRPPAATFDEAYERSNALGKFELDFVRAVQGRFDVKD